jgi:hypothetical protein
MSKTADEVEVGDVVVIRTPKDVDVRITITDVWENTNGTWMRGRDKNDDVYVQARNTMVRYISHIRLAPVENLAKAWQQVETFDDLKKFVAENMNGCTVVELAGEVVIKTGASYDMGGILYSIDEDE